MKLLKIVAVVVVIVLVSMYANRLVKVANDPAKYGIHTLDGVKDVVLIEGSVVVINWDASEVNAEKALRTWQEVKALSVSSRKHEPSRRYNLIKGTAVSFDWWCTEEAAEECLSKWREMKKK